jgi:hypothetical protein
VALGGITPPAPRAPYASWEGIINFALPPTERSAIPSSHPGITFPIPIGNSIGSPRSSEESNTVPSTKLPV